jgi:hypothetical protein
LSFERGKLAVRGRDNIGRRQTDTEVWWACGSGGIGWAYYSLPHGFLCLWEM